MKVLAEARSNVALLKYWGKASVTCNLPAAPSLSLTLDKLITYTQITAPHGLTKDALFINDLSVQGLALQRVSRHLDLVTLRSPEQYFEIRSWNHFPTSSGLASSASGFAALTLAAAAVAQREFSTKELSILARQGSGSAARSIFGGISLLGAGTTGQVDSSFATPILSETDWPELRMVVGILPVGQKETSSTHGMLHTESTSPYYAAFIRYTAQEVHQALEAVHNKDLQQLGDITERSAFRMHGVALAANPGILFWRGSTVESIHAIIELRKKGVSAWFTCDAGPHPKILTLACHAEQVANCLQNILGIQHTFICKPGAGARLVHVEL